MENVDFIGRRFTEMPTHAGVTKGAQKNKRKLKGKEEREKKKKRKRKGKRKKGTKKIER